MSRGEPLIVVLRVLRQLQSCHACGRGATLDELAAECGVSSRTIRRKVEALEGAGFVVDREIDEERRVRLSIDPAKVAKTHVAFEPHEAAALFVASGMMQAMEGLPLVSDARQALDKATESVALPFRRELERHVLAVHGSLQSSHAYGTFARRFNDLVDAIGERWPVELDYLAPSREQPRTYRVEPYLLHCQAGTVYLVARMAGRDNLSTFVLDRIERVDVLADDVFARDPAFEPERFVDESFAGWHQGEVVPVAVRFEREIAPVIRERTWHPTQRLEPLPDGGLVLRLETAGPTGVLHWIKSFLPHARILEPAWLAVEQLEGARAWLDALESDRPDTRRDRRR